MYERIPLNMITFGMVLRLYIDFLKMQRRQSATRYGQVYQQFFAAPLWADRPAESITRHDMLYFRQSHALTPAQCNKGLGLVKQAYSWASDRIDPATMQPLYAGHNPAWHINKNDYIPRERVMSESEIRLFLRMVLESATDEERENCTAHYRAFFVTRLLTPCRIKELCEMRWDAVDWQTGKWFKRLTKNKRPQYVLIPRQALALLVLLPKRDGCDFVFPGAYNHSLTPNAVGRAWVAFRRACHLPEDLQLLDFRRTLASYLYTEIKADDLTAKAVLNHYDGRPVAIYTRLNYDRLALILQQYADWIWALKEPAMPAITASPRRRLSDQAGGIPWTTHAS